MLLASTGLLVAAEAVARRAFDPPLEPYTPHPLFHLVRTPLFKTKKISIEEPPYTFPFEINALGFRGKKLRTVKKPPGTYRIFFLGASTTENQCLPEEKTFAGIVQARLDAALQGAPNVEVANCGLTGYGIARSLSLIEHRILNLEPDLIVVLDAENDMMTSLDERFDPTNALLDVDEPNLREFVAKRSRIFALADSATTKKENDARRPFNRRRAMARGRPYHVPEGVKLDHFLEPFKAYLRWVALVCHDARVPVVFMTQPTLWKEKHTPDEVAAMWMACFPTGKNHLPPEGAAKLMAQYNEGVKTVGAQMSVPVVDLAASVPKDLRHFVDDAHMTAEGNVSVAEAVLATILKDGKLIDRASR
ncbi:MAG: SGNH/GDSL hydrolase family protein [Planctomycetota bacterium]